MNIEKWENQIIAYFENELNLEAEKALLNEIDRNDDLKNIMLSYKQLYQSFDDIQTDIPTQKSKLRFEKFLQKEIDKQDTSGLKHHKSAKIKRLNFRTLSSVAAAIFASVFIWNIYQNESKINDSLASMNAQLEQMMLEESSTERIKGIRVNYSNSNTNVDDASIDLLIRVLHFDQSSNVRLAAAEALGRHANFDKVRTAMIKALNIEQDGFVKLQLIKTLSLGFDEKVARSFEQLANDQDNEKFILEEVQKELFKHERISI